MDQKRERKDKDSRRTTTPATEATEAVCDRATEGLPRPYLNLIRSHSSCQANKPGAGSSPD